MTTREELKPQDKANRRKSLAKQLLAMRQGGAFDALPNFTPVPNSEALDKYDQVAVALFDRLIDQPDSARFDHGGVRHGYNVCARIAKWGVAAYDDHVDKRKQTAEVNDLSDILGRSYDSAITPFIREPGDACQTMEYAFGLVSGSPPVEPLPFIIAPDEDEDRLMISRFTLPSVQLSMESRRQGTMPSERCPAAGMVLQEVWAATIETCAVNENLFPADITEINDGAYTLPA